MEHVQNLGLKPERLTNDLNSEKKTPFRWAKVSSYWSGTPQPMEVCSSKKNYESLNRLSVPDQFPAIIPNPN
jgi:hypothetical protein